jgi:putative peptidoglycan lipid II flippase
VAYSTLRVLTPSFYALQETRIPMLASLVSIVTNYAVSALAVKVFDFGHRGLALSVSAVAIVNSVLLFVFLYRRVGALTEAKLWQTFGKVSVAASLMGGLCWAVSQQLEHWLGTMSFSARLLDVVLSVSTGVIAFYLAARALKLSEITALTNIFARKLGFRRT